MDRLGTLPGESDNSSAEIADDNTDASALAVDYCARRSMFSTAEYTHQGELANWRAATLQRLSRLLVLVAAPALTLVALSRGPYDSYHRLVVLAVPVALIVIFALSREPRRTPGLAVALVVTLIAACLLSIIRLGATPGALVVLGSAMVLVAVFFGRRAAWWATIATTLFMVLVGGVSAAGLLRFPDSAAAFDWSKLSTWIRLAAGYLAAMSIVASVVATLIARLEADLREREALLAAERDARAAAERAHAEARDAAKQAEVANRLKDDFLRTVSHELRTPLHVIIGWAQLLRSGAVPAPRRDHALEVIVRNAASQAKLVDDLLDAGRIASGRLSLDLAIVSPADVVAMAVESVRPAADAKQVQIVGPGDGPAPAIRGDATRLHQVMTHLLMNAIEFSRTGGRVEVAVSEEKQHLAITVRDEGEGIEPSFLPHVFEAFRQADASTTRKRGGLGLGLTFAKHLVELHGGSIEAHSEGVGRGCTFVVRLRR
jgi:signal transduction histidine kinase